MVKARFYGNFFYVRPDTFLSSVLSQALYRSTFTVVTVGVLCVVRKCLKFVINDDKSIKFGIHMYQDILRIIVKKDSVQLIFYKLLVILMKNN